MRHTHLTTGIEITFSDGITALRYKARIIETLGGGRFKIYGKEIGPPEAREMIINEMDNAIIPANLALGDEIEIIIFGIMKIGRIIDESQFASAAESPYWIIQGDGFSLNLDK